MPDKPSDGLTADTPQDTPEKVHFFWKNSKRPLLFAAVLLLAAVLLFLRSAAGWQAQYELAQYGVTTQARVTARYLTGTENSEFMTDYAYSVSGITYSGKSSGYSTYEDSKCGQFPVVYSSRKPEISLPAGELAPKGSFYTWIFHDLFADGGWQNVVMGLGE